MRSRILVLIGSVALAACGGDDASSGGPDAPPTGVTYYQDLKPIIDAKCLGCHAAGGIGPFELDTVDKVSEMAGVIIENVVAKTMPPWPGNADCNQYFGDRSLTPEQIALFQAWQRDGFQAGRQHRGRDSGRHGRTGRHGHRTEDRR